AIRAIAWCGRIIIVGFAAGGIPSIKANYLLVKNIEVSGLQIGDYRKRMPEKMTACFQELFRLYETKKISPLPTTTMPLECVQDALRAIRDRTANGRIVLMQGAPRI
ncbi:zinc-binding dehydrogenase, partial [Alphaproteobacteria bacterium]|nr:zinc-binding dehydrogenase [Alphaproteobacteria bacterium]